MHTLMKSPFGRHPLAEAGAIAQGPGEMPPRLEAGSALRVHLFAGLATWIALIVALSIL